MDNIQALMRLEEIAYKLGIPVRYERLDEDDYRSPGGLCRIKGESIIIVNSRASL